MSKKRNIKKSTTIVNNDDSISLNKYISDSGFCSRREADVYIEESRVTINGKDAQKGNRVYDGDDVRIDGEMVKKKKKEDNYYIAFNKPKGITCTTDQRDPNNIIDFIGYKKRIFPVGRLDKLSDGLIFLTNDGDLVNKILRAGNGHEKEYRVQVDKPITQDFLDKMRNGVKILGTKTQKCTVIQEGETRFKIVLKQGLNRQIRRMCESLDYKVTILTRTRVMHITLKGIAPGKWRYFTEEEKNQMNEAIKNSSKTDMVNDFQD